MTLNRDVRWKTQLCQDQYLKSFCFMISSIPVSNIKTVPFYLCSTVVLIQTSYLKTYSVWYWLKLIDIHLADVKIHVTWLFEAHSGSAKIFLLTLKTRWDPSDSFKTHSNPFTTLRTLLRHTWQPFISTNSRLEAEEGRMGEGVKIKIMLKPLPYK